MSYSPKAKERFSKALLFAAKGTEMLFLTCLPNVRQSLFSKLSRSKKYDLQTYLRSFDSRLFYIISGTGTMIIEGTSYPLAPGTAVLFKAGTRYLWNVSEMEFYSVNFDYSDLYSSLKATFHPVHSDVFPEDRLLDCGTITDQPELNSPVVVPDAQTVADLLRCMTTEYHIGGKNCALYLSCALKTVILAILRLNSELSAARTGECSCAVRLVVEYIEKNLCEDLSNQAISKVFHFNPTYLGRLFKKYTGTPLHKFVLSMRLSCAAEMLRSEDASVSDISHSCGFSSPQHFSKSFCQSFGMSPAEYRKNSGQDYFINTEFPKKQEV